MLYRFAFFQHGGTKRDDMNTFVVNALNIIDAREQVLDYLGLTLVAKLREQSITVNVIDSNAKIIVINND